MMQIFDTLNNKKTELRFSDKVRIYLCGVTVYDDAHIGHARTIIVFDVLRRFLESQKIPVEFIQNFTDVDDKIIDKANQEKISALELTTKYTQNYFDDFDGLNIKRATLYPKATEHIVDMQNVISNLVDKKFEYGGETKKYPSNPKNPWQENIRQGFESNEMYLKGDLLTEHEYSNHSARVREKFGYMISNKGEIPEHLKTKKFAQRLLPKKWDDKGPTITTTSLPDDFVHFSQARSLTVREWARLQTFPDWYKFAGKRTTGGIRRAGNPRESIFDREVPKYTQIGNAVPVKLAYEIGKHFKTIL